jgi:hypothetical protein
MIKIDNRLTFTVASIPTAGAFCIIPSKQHKSARNYRNHTAKRLHHTAITSHVSTTPTNPSFLPSIYYQPASFKPT